ncbi:MAG TPA: Glu/Leu/Phe/Val dehydrogenase dimerization domain-containing protein [Bacteroidia bacterium]|nr:Glu/Leu/Phe/Val dehydrogenase dimerization domain-containing protein [Bacteroidia bacterium]HNU33368.1 Glu/Leu/Phe/Val dehydrogenase dimerization domain-containing protein [Bacteroidia bacterium]
MLELLKKFEAKRPEIVFEWKDAETEAEGWLVINSLRNGSAGGGTRMRKGLDKREVESLAKTMEVKFTVSGPAIGGAKSGINFDPSDPRKLQVLERWFKAVKPLLKSYYGTGGDLNVDEIHDVIPITEKLGILHPQEGTAVGHFYDGEKNIAKRIENLQKGVSKVLNTDLYSPDLKRNYKVADMITGYGVAMAVKHYYDYWGGEAKGKRAIIQGWGNVAAAAGFYLAQMGAKIVGIIDRSGGLINENGYTFEEIKHFFNNRNGNALNNEKGMLSFDEVNKKIWNTKAEIFVPGAASRLITKEQIDAMIASGLEVISCGANVPFADKEIFFGPTGMYADEKVSVIPDFIANCGMARVFAYLHNTTSKIGDSEIFDDVSSTIKKALADVNAINKNKTKIAASGFEIAMGKLM